MKFEYEDLMWASILFSFFLAIFLIHSWKRKQDLISKFIANSELKIGVSYILQKSKLVLIFLAFAFAFLSLARPQWGRSDQEFIEKGVDVMLVIDTSKSLLARDIKPSRFERIKLAIVDLIEKAPGNRFGIVVFAGNAFIQTPLTSDPGALKSTINALQIDMLPSAGSDLSIALKEAAKGFDNDNDQYKAVVIFSDGEDHGNDTLTTARALQRQKIKIFSVGAATSEGEIIPIKSDSGKSDYHRDPQGNVVMTRLNESVLQSVAEAAEGFYVNLQDINAIDKVFDEGIMQMPQSDLSVKTFNQLNEQFQWPLGIAMFLLVIEFLLPQHRSQSKRFRSRTNTMAQVPLIFLTTVIMTCNVAQAAPSRFNAAAEAMKTGDYQTAKSLYQELIEKYPNDARLRFNLATAEYKLGNFSDAERLYEPLLKNEDLRIQQQTFYGLGNIKYLQGKNEQELTPKKELWKNSLKMLEAATKLNPSDPNASTNKNFIENELRKLQLQENQQNQEQQQDQPQNQQQEQDKKHDQDNSNQDSQNNENNQNSSEKKEGENKNEDQQTNSQDDQDQNNEPEENENGKQNESDPNSAQNNETPENQEGREQNNEESDNNMSRTNSPAATNPVELTKQQIENFLKSVDQKSRFLIFSPTNKVTRRPGTVIKDW